MPDMDCQASTTVEVAWNDSNSPAADAMVLARGVYDGGHGDAGVPDAQVYDVAYGDTGMPGARSYEAATHNAQFDSARYAHVQVQAENIIIGQVQNLSINGPEAIPLALPSKRRECDSTVNRALRAELSLPADSHHSNDAASSNRLLSAIHDYKDDRVKTLLLRRTDPSMEGQLNYGTFAPIHLAITEYGKTTSASKKTRCAAIMKYLIFAGADLTVRLPEDKTPLIALAAVSGPHSILTIMCEVMSGQGHDDFVNWTGTDGVTALHTILRRGKSTAVRKGATALLDCGADPNLVPPSRDSPGPLQLALSNKDYRTMEALLDHGADPNTVTQEDKTLLYACVSGKDTTAVKLLLKHKANPNANSTGASNQLPLHAAVIADNLELVKQLMSKGSELDVQDDSDRAPLIYAVEQDSLPLTQALLKGGADPNVTVTNAATGYYEWAALSFAMWQRKQPAVARALIEWGADVDYCNGTYDETALHIATFAGHAELVRLLIAKEADVEARTNDYSALGIAIENGHAGTARVLIEDGNANVNCRNGYYCKTPLCMLRELHSGKREFAGVEELILERGGRSERQYSSGGDGGGCLVM